MNLTFQQKLTIILGFVGAATSAFGALGPLLTSTEILVGTVLLGFISACLGVVATVTSSQGAQIRNVAAMEGVERVSVNEKATNGIASAALDPTQSRIGPTTPEVRATLIAKAAS